MRALIVVLMLLSVLLCGCPQKGAQTGSGGEQTQTDAVVPAQPPSSDAQKEATQAPECDPAPFANGAELKLTSYVDLDRDGTDECIMGFQESTVDDLGEPTGPAFVELAKWNGDEWEEWFGIPAPDGETFLDEDALVCAEDINRDGTIELGIRFCGFGVSSRPENVYLWQVAADGLEPAIDGDAIKASSDDGVVVRDVNPDFPGKELVLAAAQMGNEAHADAHGYEVTVYGWNDNLYRVVDDTMLSGRFDSPSSAMGAYKPVQGE